MGDERIGPVLTTFGWIATGGVFLALIALVVTSLQP